MRTDEIILGPPGCGKTTALISLVEEELARGTHPDRIGFVSFTKKAATEAADRACAKFSLEREQLPHFSTLHSLCYRQLGLRRGDVLEGARLQKFADYAGVRLTGRYSEDGTLSGLEPADRVLHMENLARIRCVPLRQLYDEADDALDWSFVHRVTRSLEVFKKAHSLVDYTDMLSEFLRSRIRPQLEVLIVDECQDLSALQWRVVDELAVRCRRLIVAGDDDQVLYRWAGADLDRMIDMPGEVRVLSQSWRVPPVIQSLAGRVIRHVHRRREKEWRARAGEDGTIRRAETFEHVDADDARVEGSEAPPVLVLARNVYVLKQQVEPELRRRGVIYERHGHPSISQELLGVVRDWEALRRGDSVPASAVRIIFGWMTAGTGYKRGSKTLPDVEDEQMLTMAELRDTGRVLRDDPWFAALDKLPTDEVEYLRAALKRGEKLSGRPRVVVSTIHGSKGGEADHVILLREMAWRTWQEFQQTPEDEARVWYVAVTRARRKLTIVEGETNRRYPHV